MLGMVYLFYLGPVYNRSLSIVLRGLIFLMSEMQVHGFDNHPELSRPSLNRIVRLRYKKTTKLHPLQHVPQPLVQTARHEQVTEKGHTVKNYSIAPRIRARLKDIDLAQIGTGP